MTHIERQVRSARHRLWLNRWLRHWGWWLSGGAGAWMFVWVLCRLCAWQWPMDWAAGAVFAASILGGVVTLLMTREPRGAAAAALDAAAGLKERISTALHVKPDSDDPFAHAVVADAHRAVAGITASKLIPIRWASSLSLAAIVLLAAALSLLLPEFDLLGRKDARLEANQKQAALNRVRTAVAKPVSSIQKIAEANPDSDLDQDVKALQDALKNATDPDVLRRETVKKLDRMEDAIKNKVDSDRYKALSETKNRLKQMGQPADPKSELGRLMENLSAGEFDKAQDSIKKIREELAKRSKEKGSDPQQIEKMRKQLDNLAKKLNEAAQDKQTERELKNAGLSETEVKRVLEALAKKDTKQLEKTAEELAQRLKEKGFTKEQIQKMVEKMKQRQEASQQCRKMGDNMGKCARQLEKGDTEAAQDELGEAEQMLSEMEQMEQSLNDLEGQMAELQDARDELGDEEQPERICRQCNGSGFRADGAPCPHCQGQGRCGGRGAGARERDDSAQTAFVDKKVKGRDTGKGTIIGQQFVKGKQLKNRSQAELLDAARAAEIDATDSLEKDRIPRAYRKGVKSYFDRLGEDFQSSGDPAKTPADKPPTKAPPARP